MLKFEKGVTYNWLYKNGESVCLPVDSDEFAEKIEDGWTGERGVLIRDEDKPIDGVFDDLSDEEIRALAKEEGINNYWNASIENLLEKLTGA